MQASFRLADDVPRVIVEHPPGRRAEALDAAVENVRTEFVFPLEADAGIALSSLEALAERAWNVPAAYPSLVRCDDAFEPLASVTAPPFCRHRLLRVNYVGPAALVSRTAYRQVGGWGGGAWDLWLRLGDMKAAPEARYLLRTDPPEESPPDVEPAALRATFYVQGTPGTTYWRCTVPARRLPAAVHLGLPALTSGAAGPRFDDHEGAAIFPFPGDAAREVMVALLQEQGIPVIVEVDDNYLGLYRVDRRAGWVGRAADPGGPHSIERHVRMAGAADGVIVSTEELAVRYRRANPVVHVCPNSLELTDWPPVSKLQDGIFRIGWFASPSHQQDAHLVLPALRWAAEQPGVEVVSMGVGVTRYTDVDGAGRETAVEERRWWRFPYRALPFERDIARYWAALAQLDVGLAPVVPNAWSNCRSDVKALEYAVAGAAPILSDSPPYAGWKSGRGCLKARTPREFLNAVKRLVRDRDEARSLAAEARDYALAERTIERNVWRWQEAIATVGRGRRR